jgi:hypothetical protein
MPAGLRLEISFQRDHIFKMANRKVVGSIPDEVIFLIYQILTAALDPGVYSAT